MKINSRAVIRFFGIIAVSLSALAAPAADVIEHPALSEQKAVVPRSYLKPLLVASEIFAKEQPDADLNDFLAWVYPRENAIAVSFIRDRIVEKGPPLKVERAGKSGKSMTILINRDTFEIVSWSYDR